MMAIAMRKGEGIGGGFPAGRHFAAAVIVNGDGCSFTVLRGSCSLFGNRQGRARATALPPKQRIRGEVDDSDVIVARYTCARE